MRVLSWNMNGIRSAVAKVGTMKGLLDSLNADIVCFQETKLRRSELERELAVVDGWESFWVFSTNKTGPGYAGVATFCRTDKASVPVAVEHGLTGAAAASQPGQQEITSSGNAASSDITSQLSQALGLGLEQLAVLDSEGRALITDHGPFIVVNLYGPALTSEERVEERLPFKLNFYQVLEWRLRHWLAAGRAVLVVGDLNISPQPIDSCKPHPIAEFERRPDRVWLNKLLGPHGPGVADVFRRLHPTRVQAYTCWNTASGARIHNYGTRIDHILAAGLVPESLAALQRHSITSLKAADADGDCHDRVTSNSNDAVDAALQHLSAVSVEAAETTTDRLALRQCTDFVSMILACDIMHDFEGSDHAPVWVDLNIPVDALPTGHPAPAAAASRMFPGKQASLKAWLQPKTQHQQQDRQISRSSSDGLQNLHLRGQQQSQVLDTSLACTQQHRVPLGAVQGHRSSSAGAGGVYGSSCSGGSMKSSSASGSGAGKRKLSSQLPVSNKKGQTSLRDFMRHVAGLKQQASAAGGGGSISSGQGSGNAASTADQPPVQQQQPGLGLGLQQQQQVALGMPESKPQHALEHQQHIQHTQQTRCACQPDQPLDEHKQQDRPCTQQNVHQPQQQQQSADEQQPSNHLYAAGKADTATAASVQHALVEQRQQAVAAWQRISKAMQPPRCAHGDICVVRVCKKQNENYLRQFYCCGRPDGPFPGPGRCNYFKWVTEPKRSKGAAARQKGTS